MNQAGILHALLFVFRFLDHAWTLIGYHADLGLLKIEDWKGSGQSQPVTYLFLNSDSTSDGFMYAPGEWDSPVGTVVCVKRDGEQLTVGEMKELWDYTYDFFIGGVRELESEGEGQDD